MISPRLMPPVIGILIGLQFILLIRLRLTSHHPNISISLTPLRKTFQFIGDPDRWNKDSSKPAGGVQRVQFRPFIGNPQHHNQSVTGESLPGVFFDEQLFLIGARLTTSYVPKSTSTSLVSQEIRWHQDRRIFQNISDASRTRYPKIGGWPSSMRSATRIGRAFTANWNAIGAATQIRSQTLAVMIVAIRLK